MLLDEIKEACSKIILRLVINMCGIAAIISASQVESQYIKMMTDSIAHRGPDSEGQKSLYRGRVYLGHRRLSVLDLSLSGQQPMPYLNQRYWITYNGEIYNYIELRKELKLAGYCFMTDTDTEVIMAAYDCWGKDCLHKFNGMWAFILIDTVESKVFAARDRFGVKPFYYWKSPYGFWAFASEIKEFTVLPGWRAVKNGQRIYDFLYWALTDHTNETLFEGVYQLRGGQAFECSLTVVHDSLPIYQWYVLKAAKFLGDFHSAIEEFRQLFIDSIRLRLRADVTVGSCLSGGLDSSSIVCVVNELLKETGAQGMQKTISACSHIKRYDERNYIDKVLSQRSITGIYTYPDLDVLSKKIEQIIWHQDEPFGSMSICAQWCVFETAAEQELRVMLDGQGADEQMAGYHSFFGFRFADLFKTLQWMKLLHEIKRSREIHGYDIWFALKGIANSLLPDEIYAFFKRQYRNEKVFPAWINMENLKADKVNPFFVISKKSASIYEYSKAQLTSAHLQMLLHWEDRNSMAHSIESRIPFLDYRLVEFILGLPDGYKLSDGMTKRVLRSSMEGILPDSIRMRTDKMGFVTPEEVWMKKNAESILSMVDESVRQAEGILDLSVRDKVGNILNGRETFSFMPWRVICLGKWLRRYQV